MTVLCGCAAHKHKLVWLCSSPTNTGSMNPSPHDLTRDQLTGRGGPLGACKRPLLVLLRAFEVGINLKPELWEVEKSSDPGLGLCAGMWGAAHACPRSDDNMRAPLLPFMMIKNSIQRNFPGIATHQLITLRKPKPVTAASAWCRIDS